MNRAEMNKFIADYLQNDKTTFAMMLSGEWGTGKSFYIKGELKNFIEEWKKDLLNNQEAEKSEKKEIKKYELIIVSLYGLSSISEISQRIYFEMRTILKNKSEKLTSAQAAGKIIGKTLLNAFSSKIGFDIETDAGSFDKIYESIDLTGKLLVFEDVERTKIDLEDFFGYVNNLCEQDGVKVLLIADEEKVREKLENYDKIKDKVVGDTIHFEPDLEATLRNIFEIYGFDDVCDLKSDFKDIKRILPARPNFRRIIYACQKVKQIFDSDKFKDYKDNKQFKKCIFLSTLSFIHGVKITRYSWKNGIIYEYEKDFEKPREVEKHYALSLKLGDELYPLPLFVYEYICEQKLKKESIERCEERFEYYLKYVSIMNEVPSYNTLLSPYEHFDSDIERVLDEVKKYISDENNIINYTVLGTLLSRLAAIKIDIGIDTKECEEEILKRFARENDRFPSEEHIFQFSGGLSDEAEEYLNELIEQIMQAFECNKSNKRYKKSTNGIKEFFDASYIDPTDFYAFIANNEPEQFAEKIINSDPKTILNINKTVNDNFCEFALNVTAHTKLWLVKLKDELEKSVNSIQIKTVRYDVGLLIKTLEKAIKVTGADKLIKNQPSPPQK